MAYEAKFKFSPFFPPMYRKRAFTFESGVNCLSIYFVANCHYYIRALHRIRLSFWCKFNIRNSLIWFCMSPLHLLGNHTKWSRCQNGWERNVRTISIFSCINIFAHSWWTCFCPILMYTQFMQNYLLVLALKDASLINTFRLFLFFIRCSIFNVLHYAYTFNFRPFIWQLIRCRSIITCKKIFQFHFTRFLSLFPNAFLFFIFHTEMKNDEIRYAVSMKNEFNHLI